MKIILPILTLLFSFSSFSQDSTDKQNTDLGKASIKVGTVLKREFITIYPVTSKGFQSFEVKILNITDASSQITISGLFISNYSNYRRYYAYLDIDEIPGFLKFIEMLNKVDAEKPDNYTEYNFFSKDDLSVNAYFSADQYPKKPPYWHYGIKVDKYSSDSNYEIKLPALNEIRNLIIESKDKFANPLKL